MLDKNYEEFAKLIKEYFLFGYGTSIIHWDTETYMPKGAIEQRSSAQALLGRIQHEMLLNPKLKSLLTNLEKESEKLSNIQQRELVLFRRIIDRATKQPVDFTEKYTKQIVVTRHNWETAKKKSNFSLVQENLEKSIDLAKKRANILDPAGNPWDVLALDFHEYIPESKITKLFEPLKNGVLDLVKRYNKIMESCDNVPHINLLDVPADLEQLKAISKFQMELLKIDQNRVRIDEAAHPFCTGVLNDVRVTTRYIIQKPLASVYSTFHELGHALYGLNLPKSEKWSLHGSSVSAGIHESQSRFIENLIGKNPAFLEFFYPKLKSYIPAFEKFSTYDFTRAVNAIMPSKIRLFADEVTYNLHIILRFEIERDLFADRIQVSELPQIWNEKMKLYLDQENISDADGILQDMHWYGGYFGYFPAYALGNLYNGQMYHYMLKEIPDYDNFLMKGDINPILNWLRDNVHNKGNIADTEDFMKVVTGEKINPHYFIDYLDMKYTKIFDLG